MNKSIDVTCGIYNTEYRLIQHKDGTISVKAPYVKWTDNSGSLSFRTVKISKDDKADVLAFFEEDELALDANNGCGILTLEDVLNGDRYDGVHVIR